MSTIDIPESLPGPAYETQEQFSEESLFIHFEKLVATFGFVESPDMKSLHAILPILGDKAFDAVVDNYLTFCKEQNIAHTYDPKYDAAGTEAEMNGIRTSTAAIYFARHEAHASSGNRDTHYVHLAREQMQAVARSMRISGNDIPASSDLGIILSKLGVRYYMPTLALDLEGASLLHPNIDK